VFLPVYLYQRIADLKINLPYVTYVHDGPSWSTHLIVDGGEEERTLPLIEESFGKILVEVSQKIILSIFPHKRNPEITGSLLNILSQERIEPSSLAYSPSAISMVLKQDELNQMSEALFGHFSFGAYRTPEDWTLAQTGKEKLYKEVVASYQEQRPKVYGLEYYKHQELLTFHLNYKHMDHLAGVFKELAQLQANISFFTTAPYTEKGGGKLIFCMPTSDKIIYSDIFQKSGNDFILNRMSPVTVFSMNGPHFGDRYGIVSELLSSLDKNAIDLLGLSCTIASITGVVPSSQLHSTLEAIQSCFEVLSIIEKDM
ncbi:MAG: hypothetical protein SV375_18980, partial [Thermodesulfobacteriota bacterium]|nr:hypothetical protein [Thermodesulfobacteriota bacterium]